MSDRGVSSPLGVILLLGITIAAVTTLLVTGGPVLDDTRANAEQSQTENAMAQFSSKASLVGLGESGDQRFSLGRMSQGDVTIEPDAGRVTLLANSSDDSDLRELNSTSFGAVVYRFGDTEIAYQGGGVWERSGGSSRMISPPEYHYRLETLTFPVMTVSGDGAAGGDVRGTVRSGEATHSWYPIRNNESRSNPLGEGRVVVRIESRYCAGWESFFKQRSQGSLKQSCEKGDPDTVEVDLVVPFNIESDVPVKAKAIEKNGGSEVPQTWTEDVVAPSVSPEVEEQLEECQEDGCDTLETGGTIDDGTYWSDGEYETENNITFDTSTGNVTAVIDGELDISNDVDITGSGSVTLYVYGSVDTAGGTQINTGGGADQLSVLVHSDADDVDLTGNVQFTGVMYAPGAEIDLNGKTDLKGAIVGDEVDVNGDPNDVRGAEELEGYRIAGGDRTLTYLHVSENPIEVEFD